MLSDAVGACASINIRSFGELRLRQGRAQTAACNRLHTLHQRCCRWLLVAHDNAREDHFTLTHEFLALMMGVNRTSLSLTLETIRKSGLIRYQRASLTIQDRPRIEADACECYGFLRHTLDEVYQRDI